MSRILFGLVICIVLLAGVLYFVGPVQTPPASGAEAVRAHVEGFGEHLQNVSLLAQREQLSQEFTAEYGAFVASELLSAWLTDPKQAPGRLTSSPWPDRIEVRSVEQIGEGEVYHVEGEIVEVTNEGGGIGEAPTIALRRPVTLEVVNTTAGWRITEVTLGAYPGDGEWVYSEPNAYGSQFQYPRTLPTRYISAQGWPPVALLSSGEFSCVEGQTGGIDPAGTNVSRMIGDREYCVWTSTEAAAGSTYTTYEYKTEQGDFVAAVGFTLRFPQCANYGEDEQPACEAEQRSFDIDGLADRIASSIRML